MQKLKQDSRFGMEHNYYPIRIQELLLFKIIFDCEFNEFFEGIEYPVRVDKS